MDKDGCAVFVNGEMVAWFSNSEIEKNWDYIEEMYCRGLHFGEWLIWRAKTPELIPLTEEEKKEVEKTAKEWKSLLVERDHESF